MRSPKAFTLIELLIVVAVIALLAAIALPNFLEAQTRAKVARVKADIRVLVTATEAYHVDHQNYPPPARQNGSQGIIPYDEPYFETKASSALTTPIAYMTSLCYDVFGDDEGDDVPYPFRFHYATRHYADLWDQEFGPLPLSQNFEFYAYRTTGANACDIAYLYLSQGPDNHHNAPDEPDPPCPYDPTNGSTSRGDLVYFAPGVGFNF